MRVMGMKKEQTEKWNGMEYGTQRHRYDCNLKF